MSGDDIKALLEKAKESLDVARDLVQGGHFDFAASRAYYAMFYVASALLAHLGQAYSKHSAVIAAFGREYAKTHKLDGKFHKWLITAQNLRITGDYGIGTHVPREQAEAACDWADEFIRAAETYIFEGD